MLGVDFQRQCDNVHRHVQHVEFLYGETKIGINREMYIFYNCIIFSPLWFLYVVFRNGCTCLVLKFVNTFSVFNKTVILCFIYISNKHTETLIKKSFVRLSLLRPNF